jgi:predicted small secreted protein
MVILFVVPLVLGRPAHRTFTCTMAGTRGMRLAPRLNHPIKGTRPMVRKVIFSVALTGLMLGMTACKTVKGLGGDIQSVGQARSDAINGRK